MKRFSVSNHTISGVFVFLLLGIFAVASTVMVLLGAQAYQGSADRAQMHNAERIASAYLRSKLREADAAGRILPDTKGRVSPDAYISGAAAENSAHLPSMQHNQLRIVNPEERTVTLLYVFDGMLYEWYTLEELADAGTQALDGTRGEAVCPLDEIEFLTEGQQITISLRNGDAWSDVIYTLRSARTGE